MRSEKDHNPGCLAALLALLGWKQSEKADLPYRPRSSVLSQAELAFFCTLTRVVGTHLVVFTKMRLADVFVVSTRQAYASHFNRISQRHVDFLLCQPETLKPVAGIELDDSSHEQASRRERDRFVEALFKAAGLPLIRVPVRSASQPEQVVALLRKALVPGPGGRSDAA